MNANDTSIATENLSEVCQPKTVIFMRSRDTKQWSIERVFRDIVSGAPEFATLEVLYAPYRSTGLLNRIRIMLWAYKNRSEVNHISGDIQYIAALLPKKRTISTFHDIERLSLQTGWKRRVFKWIWLTMPIARSQVTTVISERTKNDILTEIKCLPDRIRVVENPVSPCFVYVDKPFNAQRPRLLQIGTRPNKNLPRVIEAIVNVSCTLVLVGEISCELQNLLHMHAIDYESHIDITDEELVRLYQGCDIVIFASLFEGFGLVAIEGQSCGRPVVTSIGEPFDQVVGDTACRVDPESVADIRRGISRVIKDADYRHRLVAAGIENARRYTPEVIAAQYLSLYKEVANI